MNKAETNTILLIKSSANFMALWIVSLVSGVPIILLFEHPNSILFIIVLIVLALLIYLSYQEFSKVPPALHMMENQLELKNSIVTYNEIEYYQFVGYKVDKKMTIDTLWWTPRILQLHIKTINGQVLIGAIPNKLGNYEAIKRTIRAAFQSVNVEEKEEKLR